MTATAKPIQGSLVAIVTPMHPDGSLDLQSYKDLIDWHIKSGTHGIVAVGTTGESPTVDVDEHLELIRVAVEQAKGIVAVKAQVPISEAFEILQATAVERHDSVVGVAQSVVDRVLTWQDGALRPATLT